MPVYQAKVADILRSSQRDESFVNELSGYVSSILKLSGSKHHNRYRKLVPSLANLWYYILTSGSSLQTLGEEYAGILRVGGDDKLTSSMVQILWLALFIGGEAMFDKLLTKIREGLLQSQSLQDSSKDEMIKVVDFLKDNKQIFMRCHQSIFYIYGKYYNISNRLTGIKYVLLRQWFQDGSSTSSFKLLGQCSLLYLLYMLLRYKPKPKLDEESTINAPSNDKICVLCTENRKNTSATSCGHLFCWECICDSLKYNSSCPICRENVNPSRIILLQNYL